MGARVSLITIIDALIAAGGTVEQVAAVVRAEEAQRLALEAERLALETLKADHKREGNAERQRRHRQRNAMSRVTSVSNGDKRDIPPPLEDPVLNSDRTEGNQIPSPLLSPRPEKSKSDWPVDGFEAHWWPVYPRKTAKGTARKIFDRIRRDGRVPWVELMAGTRRFAQFPPEPKFIPHPATWLNAERWTDEPAAINPSANSSDFSRSGADQIISAAHRRLARIRSGGRPSSEGSFDFNGNAQTDDDGCRSVVIDNDGQAPGDRSNGGDFSALLFSSPSRIARSF